MDGTSEALKCILTAGDGHHLKTVLLAGKDGRKNVKFVSLASLM